MHPISNSKCYNASRLPQTCFYPLYSEFIVVFPRARGAVVLRHIVYSNYFLVSLRYNTIELLAGKILTNTENSTHDIGTSRTSF